MNKWVYRIFFLKLATHVQFNISLYNFIFYRHCFNDNLENKCIESIEITCTACSVWCWYCFSYQYVPYVFKLGGGGLVCLLELIANVYYLSRVQMFQLVNLEKKNSSTGYIIYIRLGQEIFNFVINLNLSWFNKYVLKYKEFDEHSFLKKSSWTDSIYTTVKPV